MSKRKEPSTELAHNGGAEDSGSDDDMDMVDVDFEWFDSEPEIDFHGLKTLLRQLFDADNQLFDLSELVDLILSQPKLGSTVKVDGKESDPFAFLTVLNLQQHRERQVIKDLTSYLSSKTASVPPLASLNELLSPATSAQVGLILSERLINMPAEVVPPLYNFMLEELRQAIQEKPYNFTHYLVVSKTYTEVISSLDAEEGRPSKKKKSAGEKEVFYFHPEDEVLQRHALGFGAFEYTNQGDEGSSDSKRAFQEAGIKPEGHVILIEAAKFEGAVKAIAEYLANPAG